MSAGQGQAVSAQRARLQGMLVNAAEPACRNALARSGTAPVGAAAACRGCCYLYSLVRLIPSPRQGAGWVGVRAG